MKKTISLLILLCFFSLTTYAQTTAIPDIKFEQALINKGIDSDGIVNGQILNSDAATVTYLDLQYIFISDLTGISAFVNLTSLYCQDNNLSSLDVSSNTALTTLNCGWNSLTTLNISTNTALTQLSCETNQLTSLDVSNKTALTYLSCSDNQLTSLDVSNNTALTSLYCGNDQLTTLDISNNDSLVVLNCSYSQLSTLDVSNKTKLTQLHCNNNQLTNIDISNNTALTWLDVSNNQLTSLDVSNNTSLDILWCNDNKLTHLILKNHIPTVDQGVGTPFFLCKNNPPMIICVENIDSALTLYPNWDLDTDDHAILTEDCFPKAIVGRVVVDTNANCTAEPLETGLLGTLITFQNGTNTIYTYPYDTLGNYIGFLDTGSYTVSITPPNPYWQVCPSSQQITVDTSYILQTLDWTLQPLISCPALEVDISAPFLRKTGGGSSYTVSYCNNGTVTAQNAYIEVDLDADLTVMGTSIPISSQNGTVYTFNIGAVAVAECASFHINVVVNTTAQFEQTHYTKAYIYPDTICIANLWAGAHLAAEASCQNDTVTFKVSNNGAAATQTHNYFVFEDDVAMRSGTVQLGANASVDILQAASTGRAYRIEIEQAPNFPALLGDSLAMASIEGCNPFPDGSFNTGFITQFSNGNSSPFIAVDCQQNVASYDPNDKSAQPAGYAAAHYIYQNTDLDYKIRFQNTGTDTAFNVVILDTLSSLLDLTTIKMGASSHNYNWTIENGNVLRVNFNNIMLVDSNANEPLSHGFFRYRIEQKANNPLGSVIENSAAIYFDYNPVVLTNTTFHTIGENFVTMTITGVEDVLVEDVQVKVYPNPFSEQATFEVEGGDYQELQLTVYDITGRDAMHCVSTGNKIQIQRGYLLQGVYIYQLIGDGQLINTGKIIVK